MTGGRGQHIQRIRGGEPVLREAARGPEQATVPLTFTTGGDPRRQPGHVHIGVPIHTARRRTARCGVGVEEVPQPLRVQDAGGAGVDLLDLVPACGALDGAGRGRDDDVAAVAAEVDPRASRLPRPLLRAGRGRVVGVHPAGGRAHQQLPPVHQPGAVGTVEAGATIDRAVHIDIHHDRARGGAGRDADVRPRGLPPPRLNLIQVGGGVVEAVLGRRPLPIRGAWEDRHARSRELARGCRQRP